MTQPEAKSDVEEFVYGVDINEALHQENSWYLIPSKYCLRHLDSKLHSLVFHICDKSWLVKSNPDDAGVERLNVTPYIWFWRTLNSMKTPCRHCHSEVPNSIITLFTLHNWDALQKHSVS